MELQESVRIDLGQDSHSTIPFTIPVLPLSGPSGAMSPRGSSSTGNHGLDLSAVFVTG